MIAAGDVGGQSLAFGANAGAAPQGGRTVAHIERTTNAANGTPVRFPLEADFLAKPPNAAPVEDGV